MASSLCPPSISACKRPQLSGRPIRLLGCCPLQTVSASQVFVARYPNPPLKAYPDNLAHLSALKSLSRLEASQ